MKGEFTAWNVQALFSTVLFLKIGHSTSSLSTAGGNVKTFNFKRISSSSSQCNDTAAKPGFNYKSKKNGGRRKSGSPTPLSIANPLLY